MNPQKKLSSLQDILKRQQSDFIGREEHISLFRKNLGLPLEDDSRYFVFNVWGQTGVGKSSLVRQFRKIAEDAKVVTAYIDGTQSNLPMVMGCLAEQLEQQGYKLGQFSKRYKYWQKQEELASDSAALQGFSTFLEPTVANSVRAATPMEYRAATPMEYRTSVVEYFLQSIEDPKRRQLILDAAIPRYLNKDILAQLTDEDELINWLTAMPFVEKQSDNWVYHDVVRAKILDYIPVTSSQWALHGKLADYYVQLNVEKQWSHNWQTYKLNWLYHRLCESPQKTLPIALNEFLSALNNRLTFAKQWAEIILQAGKDSDDDEVIHWGERLR